MIVVIPSSRQIELDHVAPLIDAGARFIVVDDTEGCIKLRHPQFSVHNWADRRRILGSLEHAIPRRNGASRSLGFLIAWKESDDDEVVVALDDDCRVESARFAEDVTRIFVDGVQHSAGVDGDFLNVLDLYEEVDGQRLFPRGFPYSLRGSYQISKLREHPAQRVVFNLGLWNGILDVNAIDKIQLPSWSIDSAVLRTPNAIIPTGVLACLCSMNMQFRRSVIPAAYQLPMHVEVLPNWVIDRYGDIWGGFIMKALADKRGDRVSVGAPLIRHLKEGGFERNIWQEHAGHLVNDEFIDMLRRAAERIPCGSYLEMMKQLTQIFQEETASRSSILRPYLVHLTAALKAWTTALSAA
jgi:reversibly glycosylated polypeptide